ncbi:MAG: DnaJ domain-containing protein [Deltaproteobacteria bacterium]|nr:DnaJ domain-containing protein [Deltaproteobacteria bacterium]
MDLVRDGNTGKIKSAYKRLAKRHHPDKGGDEERFKQLNEAHKQMLLWAENPQFTCRKALQGCWSYDSATNRWAPPL